MGDFDWFDDDDTPARTPATPSPAAEARHAVIRRVGEEPSDVSAERYIRPAGLRGVQPHLGWFIRKRAWMLETDASSESDARAIGHRAQKNLVPKKALTSSDPYLIHMPLYVTWKGGFVEIEGEPDLPRNVDKLNAKHQIIVLAKRYFGALGVRLEGREGAYVLKLTPRLKALQERGLRPIKLQAETLEGILSQLKDTLTGMGLAEKIAARFLG